VDEAGEDDLVGETLEENEPTESAEPPIQRRRSKPSTKMVAFSTALAVVIAAVLLVTLRGSSPGAPATPLKEVIGAELALSKQSTMNFNLHITELITQGSTFQVVNNPITASGTGVFDKPDHSAEMNISLKVATLKINLTEILLSKKVYLQFGALTPFLKSGKTWVQVPSSVFASNSSLTNVSATSPILLKWLRKGEVKITSEGPSTLSGVTVRRYKLTPDKAAEAQLGGSKSSTGVVETNNGVTFMLAIDGQDVVRQLQFEERESLASVHVALTFIMDVTKFDETERIDAPAKAKIQKFNSTQFAHLEQQAQTAPPSLV
jgi:hypothetical protein